MIKLNINFKIFFLIKIFIIYLILNLESYAENTKIQNDLIVYFHLNVYNIRDKILKTKSLYFLSLTNN